MSGRARLSPLDDLVASLTPAAAGYANDVDVAALSGVAPNAWDYLFIDLQMEAGGLRVPIAVGATVE